MYHALWLTGFWCFSHVRRTKNLQIADMLWTNSSALCEFFNVVGSRLDGLSHQINTTHQPLLRYNARVLFFYFMWFVTARASLFVHLVGSQTVWSCLNSGEFKKTKASRHLYTFMTLIMQFLFHLFTKHSFLKVHLFRRFIVTMRFWGHASLREWVITLGRLDVHQALELYIETQKYMETHINILVNHTWKRKLVNIFCKYEPGEIFN